MAAAHGGQYFTGGKERAAAVIRGLECCVGGRKSSIELGRN
jgi:hypothetical protein